MQRNTGLLVLVSVLLAWNVYLTYHILNPNTSNSITENKTVEKVVTEFEIDPVNVVQEVEEKVVTVITENQGRIIGTGSGVVYSNEDGVVHIVTNHHVIEKGSKYVVKFINDEEHEAELIGSDQYTDLALLKVEANLDVEAFKLGDSEISNVGEFVLAIGSPIGVEFENSSTFGILSGKNRVVPVDFDGDGASDWDMVVMQTDAAINPGNSGGALVNMAGELIGINSLKISSSQVEGMGFSIPINEVIPIVNQLAKDGKVEYPYLGISAVSVEDLNIFQRNYYKIDDEIDTGVFIVEVSKNSPAAKSKIKEGDVIIRFGETKVKSFKDFRKELYQHAVGDRVEIEVNRYGEILELEVELE